MACASGRPVELFDSAHGGLAIGPPGMLRPAELPGFELDLAELFAAADL
jgi:hypothetical protein